MNTSHFRFPTLRSFAQTPMFRQKWRALACIFLGIVIAPVLAIAGGSMSAGEIAATLGNLTENNRTYTIISMARSGQISSPLSGSDGAAILQGSTQQARANAINELAPLFKSDLSGQESEAILGSASMLSDNSRTYAIIALARAKRFGPSLAEDAALALKGTTQQARANAINEIAPYLRADLSGQAIATILGSETLLSDNKRRDAIIALTRAGKMRACMSAEDMNLILNGMTGGARASAMYEITNAARPQCVGGSTNPTSTTQPQDPNAITNSFDGIYYNKALHFGFNITGNKGITTVSNSPRYNVGDVMLKFNTTGQSSFTGEQLCTDGKFHSVTGTLGIDGSIDMTIKGCYPTRYKMVRTSDAPIPTVGTTPTTKPVDTPPQPTNVPVESFPPPGTTAGTTPAIVGTLGSFVATVHCKYSASKRTQLDIRWTSSNGASTYEVFRDGVSVSAPLAKNVRTFSDLNVPLGKRSVYSVRASNGQESITGNANAKDAGIGSVNTDGNSEVYCFSDDDIKIATENVTYAIFSNNSYTDKPLLPYTQWKFIGERINDNTGYFARAYRNTAEKIVVVVFRGTDVSSKSEMAKDAYSWVRSHNGKPPPQYLQAATFAEEILKAFYKTDQVIFTGHSLGGGLAQYVTELSHRNGQPGTKAVVFDSSSYIGDLSTPEGTAFISATGEVLQYVGSRPMGTRLDFLKSSDLLEHPVDKVIYDPIDKHSITELACGLVYAAAAKNENVWGNVAQSCDRVSTVRWWVK